MNFLKKLGATGEDFPQAIINSAEFVLNY